MGLPFCRVTLKASWQTGAYPKELRHLGDHVRKRRLDLGLSQREVADRLDVDKLTVQHWELGHFEPTVSVLPAVIRFLGYDPRPAPINTAQWIRWHRTGRGLSQKGLAQKLGTDQRSVWLWETGRQEVPTRVIVTLTGKG